MHIERERARRRMAEGGRGGVEGQEHMPALGQARDFVGRELGISGRQADKLLGVREAVVDLRGRGDEEAAGEIIEILNTKSVAAAHRHDAVREHREQAKATADLAAEQQEVVSLSFVMLSRWEAMGEEERQETLQLPGSTTTAFNEQTNASIDWAKWSWNPVTGCLHQCPYCYARDIAGRLFEQGFEPCFLPDRLTAPANTRTPKKAEEDMSYKNVFTCSMADLFGKWVPQAWIDAVLDVMRREAQWNYLMLTKFPQRLAEQDWPENAWVGATIDQQHRVGLTLKAFERVHERGSAGLTWLSLEPLLEPLEFESLEMFDLVILGGSSASKHTPEWVPPSAWYESILWRARQDGCAVYVKENLQYRPQEYPGTTTRTEARAPEVFFKPPGTTDR